jgi:hypothetical protein
VRDNPDRRIRTIEEVVSLGGAMISTIVSMYEEGAITADHLAAECIHMIDPHHPGSVLAELPEAVLDRILNYTRRYQPEQMLSSYGISPIFSKVEAARTWIEDFQRMREGSKTIAEEDWHRYKMEERVVEILRSFTAPNRVGGYILTIYQIAIEFAKRYESDFDAMGRPLGGVGAGYRALTVYMANQLSQRIKSGKIHQIEVLLLHPADTEFLLYKYKNESIFVMPSPALQSPIPVYRLRATT